MPGAAMAGLLPSSSPRGPGKMVQALSQKQRGCPQIRLRLDASPKTVREYSEQPKENATPWLKIFQLCQPSSGRGFFDGRRVGRRLKTRTPCREERGAGTALPREELLKCCLYSAFINGYAARRERLQNLEIFRFSRDSAGFCGRRIPRHLRFRRLLTHFAAPCGQTRDAG
jgi:hypothetical protein